MTPNKISVILEVHYKIMDVHSFVADIGVNLIFIRPGKPIENHILHSKV